MSELIQKNDNRATIRWKLLTGASALALTAYVVSASGAGAEDSSRPTIWLELGGQMEMVQGISSPFTPPFTLLSPTPDPYKNGSPIENQRAPRFAFGFDGKISFQPKDSDWIFSAGIRYGRAHGNKHVHHQTQILPTYRSVCITPSYCIGYTNPHVFNKVADTKARHDENHTVLDFQAGKDVGLGLLGQDGSSVVSAGVRIAQFSEKAIVDIYARPNVNPQFPTYFHVLAFDTWNQYFSHGQAQRSFKGLGPSLSWTGSAALAGNEQDGELALDFGINAAVLFGRQKAKNEHRTHANQHPSRYSSNYPYASLYSTASHHRTNIRSRSVTVPNVGGFAGLSLKWPNAKISIGYRYDTFLDAMDTGIDAAKKSNATFNGPYASISIGLGD